MRHARITIVPVVLAAALALSGCGQDEPAEFEDGGAQPSSGEQSTDEESPAGADEPTDASGEEPTDASSGADGPPATEDVDPTDVVAETEYPLPEEGGGPESGTVTAGVHALQVDGSTMLLTVYLTPELDGDGSVNIYQMHGGQVLSPVLNDRTNLKQYVVLSDSDSGAVDGMWSTYGGNSGASASSGQTLVWWGYYAAPEDDIDSISVSVFPGAGELDVPIER